MAPTGQWEVIDTFFSTGIMDRCTKDGRGFTLIVAPASSVDKYLHLKGLTESRYISERREQDPFRKKMAIELFWGMTTIDTYLGPIPHRLLKREDTDWEQRPEYNFNKYPFRTTSSWLFSIEVD